MRCRGSAEARLSIDTMAATVNADRRPGGSIQLILIKHHFPSSPSPSHLQLHFLVYLVQPCFVAVDKRTLFKPCNNQYLIHTPNQPKPLKMQYSIILAAAFAAAVSAQDASASASTTSTSTPPYSNPNTQYLTQTNSVGVVTGMPSVVTSQPAGGVAITTQPAVVTTQPILATIPAGLSTGLNTIPYGNTTVTVSMSGSITSIISASKTTATSGSGAAASGSGASASGSGTATGASSSSSAGAGAHIKAGGAALGFAGAMFAAFL